VPVSCERNCLLVDAGAVAGDSVLGWATRKWLSTLLEDCTTSSIHVGEIGGFKTLTDQVLVVDGVSLVLREVVEEQLQVGVEGELPRSIRGDETEDLHRAVGADVEVPAVPSKGDGGDFVTDWVDVTHTCEPWKF